MSETAPEGDLYFKQWLAGRDFARKNSAAGMMANFVYAIGSRSRRECVLVDPAWDVQTLVDLARADGMKVVGALATHYHPDHVGGEMMGWSVEGISTFIEIAAARVWVQAEEVEWVRRVTGVAASDLEVVRSGDRLAVGEVEITFLHTPGHTPGSQCFLVGGERLVSGDTLFLEGCGRTDLPGGDPEKLYHSLTTKLAKLPDTTVLYPGHAYAPEPSAPMGEVRARNQVLRVPDLATWMRHFG